MNILHALAGLLGRLECGIDFGDRVLLHSGQDVRIEVQRDPDLGVPQPFTGDLRMDAAAQHVRGMGVAQIVEADTGQGGVLYGAHPFMGDEGRLHHAAVLQCGHERLVRHPHADLEQILCLLEPVGAEFIAHGGGEGDGAAAA